MSTCKVSAVKPTMTTDNVSVGLFTPDKVSILFLDKPQVDPTWFPTATLDSIFYIEVRSHLNSPVSQGKISLVNADMTVEGEIQAITPYLIRRTTYVSSYSSPRMSIERRNLTLNPHSANPHQLRSRQLKPLPTNIHFCCTVSCCGMLSHLNCTLVHLCLHEACTYVYLRYLCFTLCIICVVK